MGAAGRVGRLVVTALAARGLRVRGLVRSGPAAGIARAAGATQTVQADLGDNDSLGRALAGVHAVFHLGPQFAAHEARWGAALVGAAGSSGVERFVYSSVVRPHNGLPNHSAKIDVERALYDSGMDYTILQPVTFMQNIGDEWRAVLRDGVFAEPFPADTAVARVDYRDVAEVAARAFLDDGLTGGTFELAAERHDRHDVAALMSDVLGRDVVAAAPPFAEWARARSLPYDDDQLRMLASVFADYEAHGSPASSVVLRALLGHEPRSLAAYLSGLAAAHRTPVPGHAPSQWPRRGYGEMADPPRGRGH